MSTQVFTWLGKRLDECSVDELRMAAQFAQDPGNRVYDKGVLLSPEDRRELGIQALGLIVVELVRRLNEQPNNQP